jgi:transcriptional repressor NrdR
MKCTQCHSDDIKVIESRDVSDGQAIRRRRMCVACGTRFTTYERIERPQLIIVKNDGTRQLFNRAKLLGGLYRACEKTPVTSLQLEKVINQIEQDLYDCGDTEVRSSRIGELVMSQLAGLNEVAYVRFASVYRRFKDIASFERELTNVRQGRHIADSVEVKE